MNRSIFPDTAGTMDVEHFFDRASARYAERYSGNDPFLRYFLRERLDKAVRGMDLAECDVLDVGSGTGELYALLHRRFPGMRFLATDVSAGMLRHSAVPETQRMHGHAYAMDLGNRRFDAVFMLGVSTYMDRAELGRNFAFIARHLRPGGRFVATFTNRHALDTWCRAAARALLPHRSTGDHRILSSGLAIHAYSTRELKHLFQGMFRMERIDTLNHTLFPFNRAFPALSEKLAQLLSRIAGAPWWLRPLSSDLMIHATLATPPPQGGN